MLIADFAHFIVGSVAKAGQMKHEVEKNIEKIELIFRKNDVNLQIITFYAPFRQKFNIQYLNSL